ncbi:uncharacterized protein LOC109257893 isoform X2 [Panthera pardus]|uniref:Uncharacterized protein LOC109257893 isoform X2 n=1 Tax=Panthera pardus TaxID=9691 RepID=A0A9V1EVR9_PANPR|nr:uncharacterized protein LOC109257893 isoform X2 [Panthera pardus]
MDLTENEATARTPNREPEAARDPGAAQLPLGSHIIVALELFMEKEKTPPPPPFHNPALNVKTTTTHPQRKLCQGTCIVPTALIKYFGSISEVVLLTVVISLMNDTSLKLTVKSQPPVCRLRGTILQTHACTFPLPLYSKFLAGTGVTSLACTP